MIVNSPFVVAVIKPEFYYNTVIHGGSNGGVLLTLKGRGFAKNQFTFGTGNEHLGNKVVLTSESKTFPCDIHPDGNTETQITCYTRPMPQGRYYIRISVDGELIPDANICGGRLDSSSCTHQVWNHYTPLLNELKTISGPPGSMVKIVGRIFTSRFGSNLGSTSNGRSESILRIYGGGNTCELKDLENDKFYGIGMTNYNWGYMNCKLQGRFIGSFNVSFLISGRFGRSLPKADLLKVSSGGKIYLFQTYAEVLSVYPKEGSLMGGTLLTIKGRNFDETTAKARVFIGDTSCKIVKPVTNDIIICRVAPKPAILPNLHAGNRGIRMESWTKNVGNDINNLFALNSTSPTYNKSWIDKGELYASGEFGARLRAFFQPMYEGLHSFSSSSTGYKQIRLSNNESESNMKLINNGHIAYLKKSKRYYMEIAYVNTYNRQNGMIQLRIFSFNSSVNNQETGLAQNAQQQLSICAETVKEIQVIKLDNLTEEAPVDEIQELRVTKPFHVGKDAMFKLIFGGTATVPLSSNAIPLDVQKALESLPMIGSGNVLVTANFTVNSAIYFIFLKLDVGNLPLIGVETISDKNGNNLTVSVKLNFNGTASNKQFAFYLDNVMSPVLPVDAPEQMVKNALDEMFRVRCQNFVTAPNKNTIFRNDFELTSDSNHNGQKIYDQIPFCGKVSVRNPEYIFRKEEIKNVYLENYPTMCAAFRGDVNINLEVKLMYRFPSATKAQSKQQYIATYLTHIDDWKYICFDILKSVKINGAVLHLLESINIKRITAKEDLYIDSIILTKIAQKEEASVLTNAMVRQLPPLSNILAVKELQVKKLGRSLYQITLESYNCTDNLLLFQTLPNKLTLNRSESVTTIPVNQLPAGVWRLQAASPPLGGSIRLLFRNEESADIPVWASKEEMEYYLEAMPTMGKMNVDIEGNCSCKTYTIEWITNPGHKDMLTLIKTNITGINVTSSVKITRYGGYYMKPVPGEHFRTIHKKPQVTAFINDISTALASGGDASFEWTMAATPTITNVNPSQGPVPINITITGSGFNVIDKH
ncbi:unnamed protein product [Acanthosepion pharaonis]|uniref:PA14 domain-containing protein n=1 Tax=Acanthosepion pharaonis TaxID=158019 RepID=A0A812D6W3_ACAPH|nr:unnamed protein product [Sepia pharaonis]